jgi:(1->4)-alpha-D-glucan 1-alpha-D-glucosylmutase
LRDTTPYVVVEKILARGEPLRDDWPVDGTTGYDFMNDVGALLHDPAGAEPLAQAWTELTGRSPNFADEALVARRKVLAENLSAELDRAARALHRIARDSLATRDYTFATLRRVLTELVVHFPVYRIYPQNGLRSATDNVFFEQALAGARQRMARRQRGRSARRASWPAAARAERCTTEPCGFGPPHRADAVLAVDCAGCREGRRRYRVLSLRAAVVT